MKIIKNSSILFLDKVINMLKMFMITFFISLYFDEKVLGIYSLSFTIVSFSPIFYELINKRILKKYYALNPSILKKHLLYILLFSIIFSLFVFLYVILNYTYNGMLLIISLLLISNILTNISYVFENYIEYKFDLGNISKEILSLRIASILIILVAFILLKSLYLSLIFNCIFLALRIIILYKFVKNRYKKIFINIPESMATINKIIFEGRFLWITNLSYILYSQIDKIMLSQFLSIESVGYYYLANMIINALYIMIPIVRQISFSDQIDKNESLLSMISKYTSYVFYLYVVIIIISNILIRSFIEMIYGIEYVDSVIVFNILSLTLLIRSLTIFRSNFYIIKEKNLVLMFSSIVSMIVNIFLNYILIRQIGLIGAPIATTISLLISNILFDLLSKNGRKLLIAEIRGMNIKPVLKFIRTISRKIFSKNKKEKI